MAESSNAMNVLKGLGTFHGSSPSEIQEWSEKAPMVLSLSRPEGALLPGGDARPAGGTTARATSREAAWDCTNYDQYAALFPLTKGLARLLLRAHTIARDRTRGNGQDEWEALTSKYLKT